MLDIDWTKIEKIARLALSRLALPPLYSERLSLELSEVIKQGCEGYWVDIVSNRKRFATNPNKLLLPYVLGLVTDDPIAGCESLIVTSVKHSTITAYIRENGCAPAGIVEDADKPDIDIDCLPYARDEIKKYAAEKYGGMTQLVEDESPRDDALRSMGGAVCSVGTWQTYLFRSAIIDVALVTNMCPKAEAMAVTKEMPDDTDEIKDGGYSVCKGRIVDGNGAETVCKTRHNRTECPTCNSEDTDGPTIGKLLHAHRDFRAFAAHYPKLIAYALRLVGRIRSMGKHAGALIIADRPLYGNLPMSFDTKSGQWKSFWTEGRNPQLSKFGFTKWDLLGLRSWQYIHECCKMIEKNHGITFGENMCGLQMSDPQEGRFGYYWTRAGERITIDLHDRGALDLADTGKLDSIFQFDTPLARETLSNGSNSFFDLMIFNAMGHPGPLAMIPDFVARRDGEDHGWADREPPEIVAILSETFGTIVYQEQLQTLWRVIGNFTATEAQEARKAVAKKWKDKLKPIEAKWMAGATKVIGEEQARAYWLRTVSFGRYAFNRCLDFSTPLTCIDTGRTMTVQEWFEGRDEFTLPSYVGEALTSDRCVAVHDNGEQEVFEIVFDNGSVERVTANHRFLCTDGEYHEAIEIFSKRLDVVDTLASRSDETTEIERGCQD